MFRILNASATETIELALPGHEFYVVALDGNPVPQPNKVKVLQLGSAERVDAIVEMKNQGFGSWVLRWTKIVIAGWVSSWSTGAKGQTAVASSR